jgi:hypothetical protein
MPNEAQVKADSTDQTVADQTDAAESTISGTNETSAYDAALAEALSNDTDQTEQDAESAEIDEEVEETQETEEQAEEEQVEEVEEQTSEDDAGETAEQEETEAKTSKKIRFSNPEDLAVAAIAKAKKISLVEAAKIFSGEQNSSEHQAQKQETSQTAEKVDTVDSVQARIEELEDMEAQASTALEFETANEHRKEANKLRNKLIDLKIAEVQEKSQAAVNAERKFLSDYAASEAEAVKYYPDAAKADSPLHKEILRLEAEMQELGDPLYHSEKKPFALAKQAAKNLGIPMTNPNKAAPKKVVQNRPIQPAGGNARTTTPTTPISKIDQAVDSVKDEASYDALVAELLS